MYRPTEHLLDKLQISAEELNDFEQRGILKGVARAGRGLAPKNETTG